MEVARKQPNAAATTGRKAAVVPFVVGTVVAFAAAAAVARRLPVGRWTFSAGFLLVYAIVACKMKMIPVMPLVFAGLVVCLVAAVSTDIGFRYVDDGEVVHGNLIVWTSALVIAIFGMTRGWF